MTQIKRGPDALTPSAPQQTAAEPTQPEAVDQAGAPEAQSPQVVSADGVDPELPEHHEKEVGKVAPATVGPAPQATDDVGAVKQLDQGVLQARGEGGGLRGKAVDYAAHIDKLDMRRADPELMAPLVDGARQGVRKALDCLRFALGSATSELVKGHVLEVFTQAPDHLRPADISRFRDLASAGGRLAEQAFSAIAAAATRAAPLAEAVSAFFDPTVNAAAQQKVVRGLIAQGTQMSAGQLDLLVEHALETDDVKLKGQLMAALVSPLSDKVLERAGMELARAIKTELGPPTEGTPLGELAELGQGVALMTDARFAGALDLGALERRLGELVGGGLGESLARVSAGVVDKLGLAELSQRHVDYLRGEPFQQRLRLLTEPEQTTVLKRELALVGLLAPDQAEPVQGELALRALQDRAVPMFDAIGGEQEQKSALLKAINVMAGLTSKGTQLPKALPGLPENIAKGLEKADGFVDTLAKGMAKLSGRLIPAPKLFGALSEQVKKLGDLKALKLLGELDKAGLFTSLIGGANLIGVMSRGEWPKDEREALGLGKTIFKSLTSADDFLKLVRTVFEKVPKLTKLDDLLKLAKLAKVTKVMKWLGPIGDVIGMGADAIGIVGDIKKKLPISALLKVTSAVGGAISAFGGATALAAPLVTAAAAAAAPFTGGASVAVAAGVIGAAGTLVGVGTAVCVGASLVDGLFPEEKAQKLLGKLKDKLTPKKDEPVPAPAPA